VVQCPGRILAVGIVAIGVIRLVVVVFIGGGCLPSVVHRPPADGTAAVCGKGDLFKTWRRWEICSLIDWAEGLPMGQAEKYENLNNHINIIYYSYLYFSYYCIPLCRRSGWSKPGKRVGRPSVEKDWGCTLPSHFVMSAVQLSMSRSVQIREEVIGMGSAIGKYET